MKSLVKSINYRLISCILLCSSVMLVITDNTYSASNQAVNIPAISILLLNRNPFFLNLDGWGEPGEISEPATDTDAYQRTIRLNQISGNFESALEQAQDDDKPVQKAIDLMKSNPDIRAIEAVENTIYIYDNYGGRLNIPLFTRENRNAETSLLNSDIKSVMEKTETDNISSPNGKRALIFSGYQDVLEEYEICDIKDSLTNAGFVVDFIVNKTMCGIPANPFNSSTIEYLLNIYNYDLIYISTHGGPDEISTGIPIEPTNQDAINFLKKSGIEAGKTKDDEVNVFFLKSDFFKNNNGYFDNAIFHVDACLVGLHRENFSQKLIAKGASLFIAYNDYTSSREVIEFSRPFYARLSIEGTTINNAIYSQPILPTSWSHIMESLRIWFIAKIQIKATPDLVLNYSPFINGNNLVLVPNEVPTVTSAGQVWMDRNLGASRVATSSTDSAAYGDLYQWGRGADGHEKRTSPTTATTSATDVPGHGSFITTNTSQNDWRVPQNNSLWQGVSGTNNPCPSGFRLPTETELNTEQASWASNDAAGAYTSPLKLVVAGYRSRFAGTLYSTLGHYWSSTVDVSFARHLIFDSFDSGGASVYTDVRAVGGSLRCLKD